MALKGSSKKAHEHSASLYMILALFITCIPCEALSATARTDPPGHSGGPRETIVAKDALVKAMLVAASADPSGRFLIRVERDKFHEHVKFYQDVNDSDGRLLASVMEPALVERKSRRTSMDSRNMWHISVKCHALIAATEILQAKGISMATYCTFVSVSRAKRHNTGYQVLFSMIEPAIVGGHVFVLLDRNYKLVDIVKGM